MDTIETIDELKRTWPVLFPDVPTPSDRQFAVWITRHGQTVVRQCISQLGLRHIHEDFFTNAEHLYRFASAKMNRMSNPNPDERRDDDRGC